MIKAEESGTMYDFMSDGHVAPEQPEKGITIVDRSTPKREVNWQSANNERFKRDLPGHVKDAMTVTQTDQSYYAFQRFAFGHPVRDNFEQQVNARFGKLEKDFDFRLERERYMKLYRELMG